jgi:hypothetical protein
MENPLKKNTKKHGDNDSATLQTEDSPQSVLNSSMLLFDQPGLEKFFVLLAPEPYIWRHVTILVGNGTAPQLEEILKDQPCPQQRGLKVLEYIKGRLNGIQYDETVTKLEFKKKKDGCSQICASKDEDEIVQLPTAHLGNSHCQLYRDRDIKLVSPLGGFLYKVRVNEQPLIRKDLSRCESIPLDAMRGVNRRLYGLITNEDGSMVKGFLMTYELMPEADQQRGI